MGELERLGESAPFGSLLLELLAVDGWAIYQRAGLGGGVLLLARHPALPEIEIAETAASLAAASSPLFVRCVAARRRRGLHAVDAV